MIAMYVQVILILETVRSSVGSRLLVYAFWLAKKAVIITVFSITFSERLWHGYPREVIHAKDFENKGLGKNKLGHIN